jgi:hypothetical protein
MGAYDSRPHLTGQGTYGPLHVPGLRGPAHFWERHHSMPPAQNTLVVWKDGRVEEGNNFGPQVFTSPDVHRIFVGGYDHRCDPADDPFSFAALAKAGYSCFIPTQDIYMPNDTYTDQYPIKDTPTAAQIRAAQIEAARLARIAELERELAALRGLAP